MSVAKGSELSRLTWLAVRIASTVTVVVVPFGYASARTNTYTGLHTDVIIGAGFGLAMGVGVGLRSGTLSAWTGILTGSIVGIAATLITGAWTGWEWVLLVPPVLALAVGLIDGLGRSALCSYRDVNRETFIVAILLSLGLFFALVAQVYVPGTVSRDLFSIVPVLPLLFMPWIALIVGVLSHRREGWRNARPPLWMVLRGVVMPALFVLILATGKLDEREILFAALGMTILPAVAFLLGRTAITLLRPRLLVYSRLVDYFRVMWLPIGGFAVGYLTVIVVFAGFYGMMERFSPGAFACADVGIVDWLSFAFFAVLGPDFTTIGPVSAGARVLVGVHLILTVGWAMVVFAAVMSSIQPRLERIARRQTEDEGG